jgi:hypothetical protein
MFEQFFAWITEKTESAIWRAFDRVRQRLETGADVPALPPPEIKPAGVEEEPVGKKGRYR